MAEGCITCVGAVEMLNAQGLCFTVLRSIGVQCWGLSGAWNSNR